MLNSTTSATAETTYAPSPYEQSDAVETFDNLDDVPNDMTGSGKDNSDWTEPLEEEEDKQVIKKPATTKKTKEDVGEELKLLSDSDQTEEDKPAKDKKEDKKEDEDEEKETEEEEEPEVKEGEEEEKELPKDSKGKVKIRVDGELFGIDPDAAIRTKVDGEWKDVPVSELQSAYSSREMRTKAFEEVKAQKVEIEQKSHKLEVARNKMKDLIDPIIEIINDETKDPYEAMEILVDKLGGDPQKLYKRSIEARLGELTKLLDMSDVERENYFLKKETDFLRSRDSKRMSADKEAHEANTFRSSIDNMRKEFEVSEQQFVEAVDELEKFYSEEEFAKLDTKFMVQYAAQRPHIMKVKELVGPYVEEIGESKISDLVGQLSHGLWRKEFTEAQVKEHLKSRFGVTDGLKELNRKLKANAGKKPEVKETESSDRIESFADLLD